MVLRIVSRCGVNIHSFQVLRVNGAKGQGDQQGVVDQDDVVNNDEPQEGPSHPPGDTSGPVPEQFDEGEGGEVVDPNNEDQDSQSSSKPALARHFIANRQEYIELAIFLEEKYFDQGLALTTLQI